MAKIAQLVESRANPEFSLREIVRQIDAGELKVGRVVVVVETPEQELEFFASGPRTDGTNVVGLLTIAAQRIAMMESAV